MNNKKDPILPLSDEAVAFASFAWDSGERGARIIIQDALDKGILKSPMPRNQFTSFVANFLEPQQAQVKPSSPAFKTILTFIISGTTIFCLFLLAWGMFATPIINAASLANQPTRTPFPTQPIYPTINAPPSTTNPQPSTDTCLDWSNITPAMQGQTLCVYGIVSSIRESPSLNASYIYFGTRDEFFFVIPATVFNDLEVNHCVVSEGTIQLNTYKTPYIQITELFACTEG